MNRKFQVPGSKFQVRRRNLKGAALRRGSIADRKSEIANGFTLVEILVAMALLSLIVLALMSVFSNTQAAFRANLTQSDVLGSGRQVMDLITRDLQIMAPSDDYSNGAVNFYAGVNPDGLLQSLPGSSLSRTNVLEDFFILSRRNVNGGDCWVGTGYAVVINSPDGLYSLYRFTVKQPVAPLLNATVARGPRYLFYNSNKLYPTNFQNFLLAPTNYSHLLDGVVALRVRAYDAGGYPMANLYQFEATRWVTNRNVLFFAPQNGETGFSFYSNSLPASVEVELGVLEDHTLQHAEGLVDNWTVLTNYLAQHAGQVHLFRQRVWIRNCDPSVYQ
ncbi:MAG: prepilin-type N-terminal cleavage/methylation domain-containing protein [Verrucomicrobiota bacterium]|nr:prepilin-type N-terminal cleavage/methylation domain-containing protein [Verrucomicrobiota bacterium]